MTPIDQIQMMQRCANEIREQRAEIARLHPKAAAWDALCQILDLLPQRTVGHKEDLAWRLDREIEKVRDSMTKPEPEALE